MRQSPSETMPPKTSMTTTLIVITVAVFVMQQVLNVFFPGMFGRENQFMANWFSLSGQNFQELKVWTLLSYGFMHSTAGFFHIFGNMLGLFFIGRIVEPVIGRERFLGLYLAGTLLGGCVYLFLHFNEYGSVVGASAAVMAILTLFCLIYPERPITLLIFFIIPVTVKPKWVFWGSLAVSIGGILFYELPNHSHVAHSAHLGGMLAGILYFRYIHNRSNSFFSPKNTRTTVEQPAWFKRRKKTEAHISYKVNRSNRDELQKEVDRILDKINASGFGSLTDSEKHTLDRAKDLLSR
ncbi:rhomboid family intramembrane serine protease [Coraliomargarita algicola]|uniref:Rhomboid family intramembrane serine protease n=1 Tax=Coraliomargarita algicola TaxID=3092156 RepID=A0ABZ0RSN8_9BACT|nr:rhomboid family intramembrane serine protease [Coraliomargarita sp. J2-16]WPJ98188.1 rhomboid family intramembrane serine protease [Coraliomargarita sp. J2-16]